MENSQIQEQLVQAPAPVPAQKNTAKLEKQKNNIKNKFYTQYNVC